jgi:hypothetical protein
LLLEPKITDINDIIAFHRTLQFPDLHTIDRSTALAGEMDGERIGLNSSAAREERSVDGEGTLVGCWWNPSKASIKNGFVDTVNASNSPLNQRWLLLRVGVIY